MSASDRHGTAGEGCRARQTASRPSDCSHLLRTEYSPSARSKTCKLWEKDGLLVGGMQAVLSLFHCQGTSWIRKIWSVMWWTEFWAHGGSKFRTPGGNPLCSPVSIPNPLYHSPGETILDIILKSRQSTPEGRRWVTSSIRRGHCNSALNNLLLIRSGSKWPE